MRNAELKIFSALGQRLSGFGGDEASRKAMEAAVEANPWFTESDIRYAVEAIRTRMLQPDTLREWPARYDLKRAEGKDVAVIMAGNIPLVGFSDLLCVIAAGCRCHIKMSSKDTSLMRYVVGLLREIDSAVPIAEYREGGRYDAVIATGSDNTNRYFRAAFANLPALLRGSRSSVAVLDGTESIEKLKLISGDVFRYSGLGCRNTSLIFVPEDYDIEYLGQAITPSAEETNPLYINNYRQNKALLSVKGEPFADFGRFVMQEREGFPMSISSVNYRRYHHADEVVAWLAANDEAVQCIVSEGIPHPRAVPFGQAHLPYPWDYPDGRDVQEFLRLSDAT
jgi:hypothetical protein